jgi:hypothetical protein
MQLKSIIYDTKKVIGKNVTCYFANSIIYDTIEDGFCKFSFLP